MFLLLLQLCCEWPWWVDELWREPDDGLHDTCQDSVRTHQHMGRRRHRVRGQLDRRPLWHRARDAYQLPDRCHQARGRVPDARSFLRWLHSGPAGRIQPRPSSICHQHTDCWFIRRTEECPRCRWRQHSVGGRRSPCLADTDVGSGSCYTKIDCVNIKVKDRFCKYQQTHPTALALKYLLSIVY